VVGGFVSSKSSPRGRIYYNESIQPDTIPEGEGWFYCTSPSTETTQCWNQALCGWHEVVIHCWYARTHELPTKRNNILQQYHAHHCWYSDYFQNTRAVVMFGLKYLLLTLAPSRPTDFLYIGLHLYFAI